MSKTAIIFFTLLLVLACCFIAGCSSAPSTDSAAPSETSGNSGSGGNAGQNTAGLSGQDAGLSQRYAFEDIVKEITSSDLQTQVNMSEESGEGPVITPSAVTSKKQIRQIRASDIDESGAAKRWTFIVEHDGMVSIVSFGHEGLAFSGSPGTLNQPEILTNKIISPSGLFKKNHDVIFNTSLTGTDVTRDLSLLGNNYTISVSTGRDKPPRVLVFDATTGVLISSND
jgi:hypothetical protein